MPTVQTKSSKFYLPLNKCHYSKLIASISAHENGKTEFKIKEGTISLCSDR